MYIYTYVHIYIYTYIDRQTRRQIDLHLPSSRVHMTHMTRQVPDPSTTDAFILEVRRGLDGSRLKFDLEETKREGTDVCWTICWTMIFTYVYY